QGPQRRLGRTTDKEQDRQGYQTAASGYGIDKSGNHSGASGGSLLVQKLDPQFIKPLITLLLALVFIYMLLNVHLGRYEQAPRMGRWPYYGVFGLSLGFYDGFFGPGTGSFWTFSHSIGLVMAIGQLIGARLGSGLAMSRGVGIIRPIYLAVVFVTIVRLLAMNFFPSS
ncbi:MAG: TSUP family transporter, partial [Desulfofustis sp.]